MLEATFLSLGLMVGCNRLKGKVIGYSCWAMVLAIALQVSWAIPGWGQTPDTARVVLDGRELFPVTNANELSASERANAISQELTAAADRANKARVSIEMRNDIPVILVNGNYLMSVTQPDANLGQPMTPQAQAQVWQKQLQDVLTQAQQERQGDFLLRAIPQALVALLLALALHRLTGWIWSHYGRPLVANLTFSQQEGETPTTGTNLLLRLTLFLTRATVWLGTAIYITNLFPLTRQINYSVLQGLRDGLLVKSLSLGDQQQYSILDLFILFGVLLAVVIGASTITNLLRSRILRLTGINRGAQEAIAVVAKYSLIFIGTVVVLQIWGINLSSLALIASALGVGIGLGLQNIAKDFVSGLIMVFERPVQVGDFVDSGQFMGTIERIGARSTEIRTLDHVSIIVPNSRFLEQEVINWSHRNPVSRLRLPVGVSYKSHPPDVRDALLEACENNPHILHSPSPQVFFTGFGDSALEFELLVWIAQPSKQIYIKSELFFAIEAALRRHQIEIPFPQRDLHIRSGSLPIDMSPEAKRLFGQFPPSNNDSG
jgi:potassium efflux system protein